MSGNNILSFLPSFTNTTIQYRGIEEVWVGTGDSSHPGHNNPGSLYVSYSGGIIQELGKVSVIKDNVTSEDFTWSSYKINDRIETRYTNSKTYAKNYVDEWMNYIPIEISTLKITSPENGIAENGTSVSTVTLSYTLNKAPADGTTATLNNSPVDSLGTTGTISYSLSPDAVGTTSFVFRVTDPRPDGTSTSQAEKSVALNFYDKVYYGTSQTASLSGEQAVFANGLTSVFDSNGKYNFSVKSNTSGNKYVWYLSTVNTCKFTVGGFTGGFEPYVTITINGKAYYAYRSTNKNIGNVSVTVS